MSMRYVILKMYMPYIYFYLLKHYLYKPVKLIRTGGTHGYTEKSLFQSSIYM